MRLDLGQKEQSGGAENPGPLKNNSIAEKQFSSMRYQQKRKLFLIIHESSFRAKQPPMPPLWRSPKSFGPNRGYIPGAAFPSERAADSRRDA
jgi:hypothetical protein